LKAEKPWGYNTRRDSAAPISSGRISASLDGKRSSRASTSVRKCRWSEHHPGEEIIYILEGSLEYEIEGQPPKTFNAGDALTVPAGAVHAVRNVGTGNAAELATYVVEKGKPLLTLVK